MTDDTTPDTADQPSSTAEVLLLLALLVATLAFLIYIVASGAIFDPRPLPGTRVSLVPVP